MARELRRFLIAIGVLCGVYVSIGLAFALGWL
jgi:hypothetical protein